MAVSSPYSGLSRILTPPPHVWYPGMSVEETQTMWKSGLELICSASFRFQGSLSLFIHVLSHSVMSNSLQPHGL